jgi:hypothetical protein
MAIEIDEAELANYKALSGFLNKALANPKTRREILKVQKQLDPNASIPELDANEPVLGEVDALRKELASFREENAKERHDREERDRVAALTTRWNTGRDSLRKAGYNEDGIKKIEEIMEQEGIANHDVAQAYFERLNPPPAPVRPAAAAFNMLDQIHGAPEDVFKDLISSKGQDDNVLQRSINKVLSDTRSGRV